MIILLDVSVHGLQALFTQAAHYRAMTDEPGLPDHKLHAQCAY